MPSLEVTSLLEALVFAPILGLLFAGMMNMAIIEASAKRRWHILGLAVTAIFVIAPFFMVDEVNLAIPVLITVGIFITLITYLIAFVVIGLLSAGS